MSEKPACDVPTPAMIQLPCPRCGDQHANFAIELARLDDQDAFVCHECEAELSFAEMRFLVNVWACVLRRVSVMATGVHDDLAAIVEVESMIDKEEDR